MGKNISSILNQGDSLLINLEGEGHIKIRKSDIAGKSLEEIIEYIYFYLNSPINDLTTIPDSLPETKESVERNKLRYAYEQWKMWNDLKAEATARSQPALVAIATSRTNIWWAIAAIAIADVNSAS